MINNFYIRLAISNIELTSSSSLPNSNYLALIISGFLYYFIYIYIYNYYK